MKRKRMKKEEFARVANCEWNPVLIKESGMPDWMRGIPKEKVCMVLASGTYVSPQVIENNGVTISGVIGGLDVYRWDAKDSAKGYPINKDHYLVLTDPEDESSLLVYGPLRDDEHWTKDLPDLPKNITIIG